MRRLTLPVYLMAVSVIAVLGLIGYTVRENYHHQQQLAAAVDERQREINRFLRVEVCDRFELRDEIHLSYLREARERYRRSDPRFSRTLADAIIALEFTQRGCVDEIPAAEGRG